ncbi:MAG: hypothetical protein HC880_01955 [Bacteroidia bacterium]|nr:hypothetical protein [Bacteroidia bacterium]
MPPLNQTTPTAIPTRFFGLSPTAGRRHSSPYGNQPPDALPGKFKDIPYSPSWGRHSPQQRPDLQPSSNRKSPAIFILDEKGYELAIKIDAYVDSLNRYYGYLNPPAFARLTEYNGDFVEAYFSRAPVVAALALLTQMQIKIESYRDDLLRRFLYYLSYPALRFQHFRAQFYPQQDTLKAGEAYQTEFLLSYYASQPPPIIVANGDTLPVKEGVATLLLRPEKEGPFLLEGSISYPQAPSDSSLNFTFQRMYYVKDMKTGE